MNRHQDDYNALAGLADLAARWADTLFIVVHHTRKAEGEDVMHKISGSQGLTAATDCNAVLTRQLASDKCVLSVRPRNAEENDLVMERDNKTLRWHVVGNDERCQLSDGRQRILEWFDAHPRGGSPKDLRQALPTLTDESVRQYLSEMTGAGQIYRTRRGWYTTSRDEAA